MCGIAGIIGNEDLVTPGRLKALASALAHRGPDGEGIAVERLRDLGRCVGFVHRRLAIIDLTPTGHQPMRDEIAGNWITFNGEIYNYQEVRKDLTLSGCVFQSQSDTEVILKAYAQWGIQCLQRLRGMFAFAIWDSKREQLFLAVDHFGIKPLYFHHRDNFFAFSSEIKALLNARVVPRVLDPLAVESFLAYGTVQAPLTMIEGVHALLPGHTLLYDCSNNSVRIESYWEPRVAEGATTCSTREVLLDSVRHHLIADVPIALFLSGGIDSSALAILVNEVAGRTLDSFSVTFAEGAYAEGRYARLIGERFCARHHEITLSGVDLHRLLPQALDAMDQPTVDGVNVFVLSKAVRDAGMKVVLSGQGGDEVFGGYATFARAPLLYACMRALRHVSAPPYRRASACVRWGDGVRGRSRTIESKISQLLASDGSLLSIYLTLRQLFGPLARARVLVDRASGDSLKNGVPNAVADRLQSSAATLDAFRAISLFELRLYLANTLLRDGDIMSMAHALEVRVPLLDYKLLEHVWSVPEREKRDARLPKSLLLRQVIKQMPREIYDRQKMGFTFPWEIWMRGHLRSQIEIAFTSTGGMRWALVDQGACTRLWKEFLQRKGGVSWARIWALYVLVSWIQKNIDPP